MAGAVRLRFDAAMITLMDPFSGTGLAGYPRCLMATGDAGGNVSFTPAETTRLEKLKDAARRRDLEVSFQARRMLVAEMTGCAPAEVRFSAKEEGAPRLEFPLGYAVSISNKGPHTLVTLDQNGAAIGADVEIIREINWRAILDMVCDEDERGAFLRSHTEAAAALPDFYRLWTIKEAILKATDAGFRAGPKNIRVPTSFNQEPASGQIEAFGERFDVWVARRGELAFSLARKTA